MSNQQESQTKKESVAQVVEQQLKDGSLGKTLTDIAFVANRHNLRLSRQTLHNWYHQTYLPSNSILRLFIYDLQAEQGQDWNSEAETLLSFFQKIWEAAGYDQKRPQ